MNINGKNKLIKLSGNGKFNNELIFFLDKQIALDIIKKNISSK